MPRNDRALALPGALLISPGSRRTASRRAGWPGAVYWQFAAALSVLAVMASSGWAVAQTGERATRFSTSDLMTLCAAEDGTEDRSAKFCEGFILGTGLFYVKLRQADVIDEWACAEPVPTLHQIRQDFLTWARDNPERQDEPAIDGFWRAMAETYPCSKP